MRNNTNLNELRQRMEVMVSTFYKMFGCMPDIGELYDALGNEYLPVIYEYRYNSMRAAS